MFQYRVGFFVTAIVEVVVAGEVAVGVDLEGQHV
jgi:hypothetical protein